MPPIFCFVRLPRIACLLLAAASIPLPAVAASNAVDVGRFTDGLAPWKEVVVKADLKRNTFAFRDWDGAPAAEVRSANSMSLLARPLTLDLRRTPVLCWRWRIDAPLSAADMTQRAGDDYAARLYVSLKIADDEKSLGLRAKLKIARALWGPEVPDAAINYVWDNRQPVGTERPNVYTDRAIMHVLRSGAADAGRWVWERRDVGSDAERLFSKSASAVQLAITADTDNTGETARAGFADLHFVGRDAPCASGS